MLYMVGLWFGLTHCRLRISFPNEATAESEPPLPELRIYEQRGFIVLLLPMHFILQPTYLACCHRPLLWSCKVTRTRRIYQLGIVGPAQHLLPAVRIWHAFPVDLHDAPASHRPLAVLFISLVLLSVLAHRFHWQRREPARRFRSSQSGASVGGSTQPSECNSEGVCGQNRD